MRAVLFPAREQVQLTELPEPQAGPGQVVVRVAASGICHTDFEVRRANYGSGAFPVVPGHEFAGVVVELGTGVAGLAEGDRVVVDPNIECGTCPSCRRGWAHLCDRLEAYGVTRHGGFADYALVAASAVHPIGDLAFDRAALAEPMGCVLNGLAAALVPGMQRALVFGAGPMGLLLALALREQAGAQVALCDVDDRRLDLAAGFGFEAIAAGSAALTRWQRAADLAVEATGVPAVAAGLTGYLANGGRGLLFGVAPVAAQIEIKPFELFRRQLTLCGSHSLNHNIPEALSMLARVGAAADRLVSHRLPLAEVARILAGKPPAGSLKVQWNAA